MIPADIDNFNITRIKDRESKRGIYINELSKIRNLPRELNNFYYLTKISLSNNKIRNISILSKCYFLKCLDLSYNCIRDISALSNCYRLKYLGLEDNKIKDITALSKCYSLKNIYLRYNKIGHIPDLSKLINLEVCNLSNNKITGALNISNCNLYYLDLSYNRINTICNISNCCSLTTLNLSFNKIIHLRNISNTCLTNLDLSYNKIFDVTGILNCVNLIDLDLRNNRISDHSGLTIYIDMMWIKDYWNTVSKQQMNCKETPLVKLELLYVNVMLFNHRVMYNSESIRNTYKKLLNDFNELKEPKLKNLANIHSTKYNYS